MREIKKIFPLFCPLFYYFTPMIIVIQCKDRVGLVAAIAGLMAAEQINIISMREHVDTVEELFFARLH
jgi:formyltetrahydrofolate deformylase